MTLFPARTVFRGVPGERFFQFRQTFRFVIDEVLGVIGIGGQVVKYN